MSLDKVLATIDDNLPRATDRLMELLRIPSISTDPAYAAMSTARPTGSWRNSRLGATAEKRPTTGHPMVVGHIGEGAPHLLFYGHYDVQPVDPLHLWHRDPFDPALEDGPKGKVIRGRGASDDKGQLMTFVEACRAWIAVEGRLPAASPSSSRARRNRARPRSSRS
jgi:acetylornithine deacetylase/succinyl-diaminopimelate desuccinylase-like protein